jgi:hypothetical protein
MKQEEKDILSFDIAGAEADRIALKTRRSHLYANLKARKEGYQTAIQDKIRQDNNFGTFISFIAAYFYDNEVRFTMTQYGSHAASFKLHFARKYDIEHYNRESKEFALKNNIELGDVYKFEGPGTGANLLEHIKTFNVVEYVDALRYFAIQFEERGELVQMIKGFYLEYFEDMKVIEKVETESSVLDYQIREYYEALYTKEFIDEKYVQVGNIIMIHHKEKDFITFDSFSLEKVGPINVTDTCHCLRFDHSYSTGTNNRYYLRLERGRYTGGVQKKEQLIKILVNHKLKGDKVQVYTQDEFNGYCMLLETEKNNLLTLRNDKFYDKLSEKYEEIYRRP